MSAKKKGKPILFWVCLIPFLYLFLMSILYMREKTRQSEVQPDRRMKAVQMLRDEPRLQHYYEGVMEDGQITDSEFRVLTAAYADFQIPFTKEY